MKKGLCAIIFILLASACKKEDQVIIYYTDNNIVAHRGAWQDYQLPQNSIASLKKAIEMNCAGSEFDVWLTIDDSLVVEHDIQYQGMDVEHSRYTALSKRKLSNGEILPTLRQYLSAAVGQDQTKLFLEMKTMSYDQTKREKIVNYISELVNEMQMQDHVIYTSFVSDLLQRMHQVSPSAKTLFLGGTLSPAAIQASGFSGWCYDIDTLHAHPEWLNTGGANTNLILSSWTVNDGDQYKWLLQNKVKYVLTDVPNRLFSIIDRMK